MGNIEFGIEGHFLCPVEMRGGRGKNLADPAQGENVCVKAFALCRPIPANDSDLSDTRQMRSCIE